mgnify:CR=1 FL=1
MESYARFLTVGTVKHSQQFFTSAIIASDSEKSSEDEGKDKLHIGCMAVVRGFADAVGI